MSQEAALEPASSTERIVVLDVLRGFALVGVLIVHFTGALAEPPGRSERAMSWFIEVLVTDSFYPLLAMLFGMGFVLQLVRWDARQAPVTRLYLRRVAGLFLFGLAIWCLLTQWWILLQYAVAALALFPFRRARPRSLLLAAAIWFALALMVVPRLPIANGPFAPRAELRANQERVARLEKVGPYPVLVAARARNITMFLSHPRWYLRLGLQPLAVLLVGAAIARSRILENPVPYRSRLRHTVVWGAAFGITINVLALWRAESGLKVSDQLGMILQAVLDLGDYALGFAYGSAIILLHIAAGPWRARLAPLAYVGRTALSNIFLQFWFRNLLLGTGIGLGLTGRIPAAIYLPFTILIFGFEVWLSRWWLARHRFGPLEWLWRTMTYGHPPRPSASEVAI